jgi:photosystem II stability/assembly factor-like uncharacterized protein
MSCCRRSVVLSALFIFAAIAPVALAQTVNPDTFSAMRWRLIGPHRAGRVSAVAGVPGQTAVYYIGTPGGGVWKTTDAGRVWTPIFDHVHISSIGAVVVAPSNPNIVYVGTGEQTQGDGIYRSNDSGATWTNIGLPQSHVITGMFVDPKDANIVVVAVEGDVASGAERGIFRTTDAGKNWKKVLFKDDKIGAMDLTAAPDEPKILYTTFQYVTSGFPPQEEKQNTQNGFIYRSEDEGVTWTEVTGNGLPTEPRGRIGVAVAPGSHGKTVFAIMTQGLFRSDDGGANWKRATTDPRILGNWYFSKVFVDPKNPNAVYVAQTSMYRSLDGGKTFEAFFGAPSGDDIHMIWINPRDTRYMLLGVDQGAVISVDSGATWTEWYNQPTGQFYHVITDNRFPYYVYAAQQDSGTAAVPSRSDYGEITYRDWAPTGGFEFAYIAPDPADPNYVYIGGWYGSVLRYDKRTGQIVHVFVQSAKYHTYIMAPIVFSPQDPRTMFIGAQYVLKTTDAGAHFEEVSPDLTVGGETTTATVGRPRQAALTTIAPSTLVPGEMWAGTTNCVIQVTRDGKNWEKVTPTGLPKNCNIETIEASHHDAGTAYATVIARNDFHPYAFRTHDYGKTWQAITNGISDNGIARVVRDDPARKGLLYAGTENAAYVSFDDGDHWQSLQLNLPTTPIRDLVVHDNDLAIATYGRALWILDDLSPLREWQTTSTNPEAVLLKPVNAIRTRWDVNEDTPLPPETPAGKNPPDGAIIDYYLKSAPSGEIKMAIYDAQNNLVREYSSIAPPQDKTPKNAPDYWFRKPAALPKNAGHNRFVWDLRYPYPKTLNYSYYGNPLDYIEYTMMDHAIPGETPVHQPMGPLAVPGQYTVALTVNGQTFRQPLTVTLDPRVMVSQADLQQQLDAEKNILAQMSATFDAVKEMNALRAQIGERQTALAGNQDAQSTIDQLNQIIKTLEDLENGKPKDLGLGSLNRELARLAEMIESGDAKPATELQNGVVQSCRQTLKRLAQWGELTSAVTSANENLEKLNQQALKLGIAPASPGCAK